MNAVIEQFKGAVKTRIAQRQGWLRAKLRKPFFVARDIMNVYPETNMRFFAMRRDGLQWHTSNNIDDLTLTELRELDAWLEQWHPTPWQDKHDAITTGAVKGNVGLAI